MIGAATIVNEYDPDAIAYFVRMESAGAAPDSARRTVLNALFTSLKAPAGSDPAPWGKLRHLAIQGNLNKACGLLDLKNNFNLTEVNGSGGTPGTHVTDRGYTPASGGGALDSGFTPSAHLTQTFPPPGPAPYIADFSLGMFIRGTISAAASTSAGCTDNTNFCQFIPLNSDQLSVHAMNKTAGAAYRLGTSSASLTNPCLIMGGDFNNAYGFLNGAAMTRSGGPTGGSDALPNRSIVFGGYNQPAGITTFAAQALATIIGLGLTAAQALAIYNALNAYKTAIGA